MIKSKWVPKSENPLSYQQVRGSTQIQRLQADLQQTAQLNSEDPADNLEPHNQAQPDSFAAVNLHLW